MTPHKPTKTIKTETSPKECFVVFIDILGFSDLIEKDKGTGKLLAEIKNAVEEGNRLLEQRKVENGEMYSFWFEEFSVKSFSDCFCFSIPLEFKSGSKDYKQNLVAFYAWVHVFYNEMLNLGFLCRGGIAQGWHYHDDKLIFSKALIDAYLVESKKATYPIVMIDENFLKILINKGIKTEGYYEYMFAHDNSGRNFLHPFNYAIVDELFFGSGSAENINSQIHYRDQLLKKYVEILDKKISENFGKSQVDKYQWLKEFVGYTLENKYSDKFSQGILSTSKRNH